jgi:hypothetical protein
MRTKGRLHGFSNLLNGPRRSVDGFNGRGRLAGGGRIASEVSCASAVLFISTAW